MLEQDSGLMQVSAENVHLALLSIWLLRPPSPPFQLVHLKVAIVTADELAAVDC